MWNKFLSFNKEFSVQISWFFIGVFTVYLIKDLMAGNYGAATLDAILIGLNYWTSGK